jgi:hypothetical protein
LQASLERVYGPQQPYRECAGRSEASSGRNISHADHLNVRLYTVQTQRFANQRMLNLFQGVDFFQRGIFQQVPLTESLINADVDVLIDRGRDYESSKAAVVGGQVGAASAD